MTLVQRIINNQLQTVESDILAVEEPISIEINGLSHIVMMATPSFLEDFAIGFCYTEGIIERCSEIYDINIEQAEHGINVRLEVASAAFSQLKDKRRTLMGRTGCGICGIESLLYFQTLSVSKRPISNAQLNLDILDDVLAQFDQKQTLHDQTGATHAAAWVNWLGEIKLIREDVGRHNALDKLIGALLQTSTSPDSGFVLISSRASYEMVQKTARWGSNCLVAVSAATSRAVQCAVENNIQLIGFARPNRAVQYTSGNSETTK